MPIVRAVQYHKGIGDWGLVDLYHPTFEGEKPDFRPLILYFHGGGLESGSRENDLEPSFEILMADGVGIASFDYRLYQFEDDEKGERHLKPDSPRYPDFIEDAAEAVSWVLEQEDLRQRYTHFYISGSSAGAYLSLMLCFHPDYLEHHGIDSRDVDGYLFDAGQTTVHFNVLRERGQDPDGNVLDEAAPLEGVHAGWIGDRDKARLPRLCITWAEHDIPGRPQQNRRLVEKLRALGYPEERIFAVEYKGYEHCAYNGDPEVMVPLFMRLFDGALKL